MIAKGIVRALNAQGFAIVPKKPPEQAIAITTSDAKSVAAYEALVDYCRVWPAEPERD